MGRNMLCFLNVSELVWFCREKYIALHKNGC